MTKITPEDLRDELIDAIRNIARYWSKQEGSTLDVCDGVAFSILVLLDGCSSAMPCSFDLTAHVHPDDEDQSYEGVTISDMLHEHYYPGLEDVK